jgi:hypothetical protein
VPAVDVDTQHGKDNAYMREHINDWGGDYAYCSRDNCTAVAAVGGVPWLKPKASYGIRAKGSPAYRAMVRAFRETPDFSMRHYHKRSNAESTIGAKKRKFGATVRSKLDSAKENEEHLGWAVYNFGPLARARYEHKLKPKW